MQRSSFVLLLLLLSGCAGAEREIVRLEREGMYTAGRCTLEIMDYTGVRCDLYRW